MSSPVRAHVEALLRARKLDVTLTPAGASAPGLRVVSTGLPALDDRIGGGWPLGETSEIIGPPSSGRTAVLCASLAAATQRGELAALVDTGDTFDPPTAAAAAVDLDRLLWARGDAGDPHGPRAIDRAIKAFGLVLDAGGFGLIALDLGGVPPPALARLPFTTWRRLQRFVEGREAIALVLAQTPIARSARGLTVRLEANAGETPVWRGTSARSRRLEGLRLSPTVAAARTLGGMQNSECRMQK
ncbi:MAG TPA: hypothetical protein VIL35_04865, partial [Vicinamibacterales bacterium]